jgi:hypothetical protein
VHLYNFLPKTQIKKLHAYYIQSNTVLIMKTQHDYVSRQLHNLWFKEPMYKNKNKSGCAQPKPYSKKGHMYFSTTL